MNFAEARDYFGRMLAGARPNLDIFFMYQKDNVQGDFAVYNLSGDGDFNSLNEGEFSNNCTVRLYFNSADKTDDYIGVLSKLEVPATSYSVEVEQIEQDEVGGRQPMILLTMEFEGIG